MHAPPLDYAVDDGPGTDPTAPPGRATPADEVTLAALYDRHAARLPVTETMIRDAWRRMESEHRFPDDGAASSAGLGGALGRTLRLSRLFRPQT